MPELVLKNLPVFEVLEFRETVSETFFAGLSAAGVGVLGTNMAAEQSVSQFKPTELLHITVAGGSDETIHSNPGSRGSRTAQPSQAEGLRVRGQEAGPAVSDRAASPQLTAANDSPTRQLPDSTLDLSETFPSTLNDSLQSALPRAHGQIRKLQLAPPAATVGARNTFVADAGGTSSQTGSDVEFPSLNVQTSPSSPGPVQPPHPLLFGPADPETAGSARSSSDASGSKSSSSPTESAGSSAVQDAGATPTVPPGKKCAVEGPPGLGGGPNQSGGGAFNGPSTLNAQPSTLNAQPSTPPGPPCIPPSQQNASVADPLYVLNWHDGLVMFPNVIEFDKAGESVELRSQVYGAQVQSYSWDTSQAARAGCVTGASTYKLQFRWTGGSSVETTERITVTATMTDLTTQQQTLTFRVAPGLGALCPGSGGSSFPTTSWPTVLAPDKEQGVGNGESGVGAAVIASDSATRPYAVSQASGVLYVSHDLPSYDPPTANSLLTTPSLLYSSIAAERRPIFVGRYELSPSAAVPSTVSARLQFNGTWGPSKYYDTSPTTTKYNPGDIIQISLQADAGSLATGRYDYTFETTANYSGSSTTTSSYGSVTIINEESSPFGEGWTLGLTPSPAVGRVGEGGLFDRLHIVTGGVILNQGAGTSLWFAENGGSYVTPAGDFSTLIKNGDETYTRTLKDGTIQNFAADGLLTSVVDRNANQVTFAYIEADGDSQVDELSTITDPNGLVTTFAYPGTCGAGVSPARVCTITDPAGRVTALAYNASGTLATITDPDGAVFTFSYDAGSGRMASLVDPRSNTTSFSYDFAGRVDTVTRPDATTESFTALQVQSLCGAGQCTAGQPGNPLISAEAVADYTDPRSNAWDTRLDWFGLGTSTQQTDPLGQDTPAGHTTVLHRNANGSVTQSTDRLDRNLGFTLDSKANVTKITFPGSTAGNSTTYATQQFEYNANSQVTSASDERGNVTAYAYDEEGNLTQITEPDPDGVGPLTSPVTLLAYTADGFVESITDARNKQTLFARDARDRVTQITLPDDDADPNNNPIVSFVHNAASNVTNRTNERGFATAFTHDAMGRVLSETDPLNHTTGYQFDAAGNLTRVTNALNQSTTVAYNTMNRPVTVTDPLGNATNVTYDAVGNATQVRDPINRTTTAAYNALSYQTSTTSPLGLTTNFTRDAEAQTTAVTDPLNNSNTTAYTNRGWTSSTTDPLNNTVTMGYDFSGNMTSQYHYTGGEGYEHDGLDRLTRSTNEVSANTDYSYDPLGNLTAEVDPLNHSDTLAYDARSRLTTATDALNNSVQFLHDAVGNLTGMTDPLTRVTVQAYDAADRLGSTTLPDPDGPGGPLTNPVIAFAYDAADRLTALTDPVNNTTSWTIDAAGRVTAETNPLGTRTYVYNAASELTRVTDRNGRIRDFVYDADGRRTQELWCGVGGSPASPCPNPPRTINYTYDADGRLTNVTDPDSQYTFTYDADDRVSTISNTGTPNMPQVTLTNTYDGDDNRTSVSDNLSPLGSLSFSYDAAQRMSAASMLVSGSTVAQVSFSYDAASRPTVISRRTTTTDRTDTNFTYDNADRLTGITHQYTSSSGSTSTLASYSYSYNAASELTSETNPDGTFAYSYDNTGQLSVVDASGGPCGPTGCDETFSYDTNGNRTASTGYGQNQTYTTGTANRLLSDGIYNYSYDSEGNLLTKTRISDGQKSEFSWDYRNRLTQVVLKNAAGTILQQSDYTYDALDRRIIVSVDSDGAGPTLPKWTQTIYDSEQPPTVEQISHGERGWLQSAAFAANSLIDFVDLDGSGPQSSTFDTRRLYADEVDSVLARRDTNETVAWYLTDHLGTVRDLANTSGTILDHISYSTYGKVAGESQSALGDRFKFTGREYDKEISQYHYRARAFDPSTAHYLTVDPLSFAGNDVNLYRYVQNDPTNSRDPLGLWRFQFCAAFGIAGCVSVGMNGDRWETGLTLGVGLPGAKVSYDFADSAPPPSATSQSGFSIKFGAQGMATGHIGPVGGGLEVEMATSMDMQANVEAFAKTQLYLHVWKWLMLGIYGSGGFMYNANNPAAATSYGGVGSMEKIGVVGFGAIAMVGVHWGVSWDKTSSGS